MPDIIAPTLTGEPIPTVSHQSSASEHHEVKIEPTHAKPIDAADKLGLVKPPKGAIQGPKEALGTHATPIAKIKEDAKRLRERHSPKIVIPRADVKPPEKKPDAKPVAAERGPDGRFLLKSGEPKPEVHPPETTDDSTTNPLPVVKVKVGDKEMTPEEITARLKELEDKANKPAPKADAKPELTPEQQAEATKVARTEWREKKKAAIMAGLKLDALALDNTKIDAGFAKGDYAPLVQAIMETAMEAILNSDEDTRGWMVDSVNPEIARLDKELKPVSKMHTEIAQYESERQFLEANADIKANPKGIEEARQVRQALHNYYDQIQQKIAQNAATPAEREHAAEFEKATPEKWNEDVAFYVRKNLGIDPNKPAEAAPTKPAAVLPPSKPQPKPPGGQAPGGSAGTPVALTTQQQHIARMRAAGV